MLEDPSDGARDAAIISALRAVLAPLLARPIHDDGRVQWCLFCPALEESRPVVPPFTHAPTCPVLRKDELLGR